VAQNTGVPLPTGPDLGYDGTGALRVVAARQIPLPAAIAASSAWTNGLRADSSLGAWTAQCSPVPVSLKQVSRGSLNIPGGTLTEFTMSGFALPQPSATQNAVFVGDLEFDALIYTNGSAWAEIWAALSYVQRPGGSAFTTPWNAMDFTAPNAAITPAQANAGTPSFVWRPQVKFGVASWYNPAPATPSIGCRFGAKNVADNAPATPLPLVVASWSATLTGFAYLIDPAPVT